MLHNTHSRQQHAQCTQSQSTIQTHTSQVQSAFHSPHCLSQQRQHSPACLQWPRRACRGTRSPSVQRRSSGVQRLALLDCKHSHTHTLRSKLCSCTFSVFIMTACTAAHCVSRLSFSRLTHLHNQNLACPQEEDMRVAHTGLHASCLSCLAHHTQPCLVLAARMVHAALDVVARARERVSASRCWVLVLARTLPHLPSLSLLMLLQRRGQGPARAVRTDWDNGSILG